MPHHSQGDFSSPLSEKAEVLAQLANAEWISSGGFGIRYSINPSINQKMVPNDVWVHDSVDDVSITMPELLSRIPDELVVSFIRDYFGVIVSERSE
jgi:hypothetical protein